MNALRLALSALLRWPLRAGLSAFGILLGVAAVTIVVALGEGAKKKVSAQVDQLGENALIVQAETRVQSGAVTDESLALLTEADGEALRRDIANISHVAPLLVSMEQVIFGSANINAEVVGTTLDFFAVRAWEPENGSVWDDAMQSTGARVCVIGQTLKEELFGELHPVGRVVRIGRHPFRILGVMQEKGQDAFGRDEDARIVMPISAARSKLRPSAFGQVDSLLLRATSAAESENAERQVTQLLRQRHGLAEGVENDFRIRSQAEFRRVQQRVMGVLNLLLVSVAVVSLVVGGVGIMNIMLVSVSERTREVGIRLAIGARQRDILSQFLAEAVVLSLVGGVAGAIVAAVGIRLLASALGLPMTISIPVLTVALLVSTGIGIAFGFLPARRAAALDPIEALRSE